VWPYLSGVLKEANMVASARAGIASGSGSHTRTDVHLHLDVSPPELTALADPERIHQVVANLIDNAVKHSPAHGRVTVKARRGSLPQSLELEVLDEGPGIPKAEWAHIFERFNRGAVSSPARTRQRRRYGPRPRDRPLGGGSARRPDRCGRIRPWLQDYRHPSGTPIHAKLT
jgi:hypothetical protein